MAQLSLEQLQARLLKHRSNENAVNVQQQRTLADSTRCLYSDEEALWKQFHQAIGIELLPGLAELKLFWEWYAFGHKGRLHARPSLDTLDWRIRKFAAMYNWVYNVEIPKETRDQLRVFIATELKEMLDLEDLAYDKNFATFQDVRNMIRYLWTMDTHKYPSKRMRVQIAFYLLLLSYTAMRPGAILHSDSYRETNNALNFGDVDLWLSPSPANQEPQLHITITFHNMKGARQNAKKFLQVTLCEDREDPASCPVLLFLVLCFIDQVFEGIKTPEQLFSIRIPSGRNGIMLPLKAAFKNILIFRRIANGGHRNTTISDTLAWSTNSALNAIQKLAQNAGYPQRFTLYCIRRGVSNRLDDAQRNQIMGHGSSTVYSRSYLSTHSMVDIQSLFQDRGTCDNRAQLRGMGLARDLQAPKCPALTKENGIWNNKLLEDLFQQRLSLKEQQLVAKRLLNAPEIEAIQKGLTEVTKALNRSKAVLRRQRKLESRADWFDARTQAITNAQLQGTYVDEPLASEERPALARVLYPSDSETSSRLTALQQILLFCLESNGSQILGKV